MQLVIIAIFICSLIFLYALHLMAEDDFVILRKNITTEKVFNVAIGMGLVGLLSARFFYVLFNPKPVFFEILGFLVFPYFPGLSLIGGLVGGLIFYFLVSKRAGFPVERVFDFLAKSFFACAPFGALGIIILNLKVTPPLIFNLASYFIFFLLAVIFSKRGEKWLRDGSFGLLSIILVSFVWVASTFIEMGFNIKLFLYKENPVALFLIVVSLILFAKNEATRLRRNGR